MNTETMIATVAISILIFLFGIRYFTNKERMLMIEKAMEPTVNNIKRYEDLRYGLLLIGAGVGLGVAYLIDITSNGHEPESLYTSLVAVFSGIGLLVNYVIQLKRNHEI
jgi:hypothetical protein